MRPGPPPKPDRLKQLSGNPGKRKLNKGVSVHDVPGRMLPPPEWLPDEAAGLWRELGGRLLRAGLFTHVDKYALAMFCAAGGRWIEAERKIRETGGAVLTSAEGNLYQNPWLHTANKSWEQMRAMLGQFGLSPAERARLVVAAVEEGPATLADQLFEMVRGGNDGT